MSKEVIRTDQAPAAVGPYSQAIRANGFVFTAGQIPLDPATGKMVEGDIQVQTRRVLENLKAILEASGTSFAHVCKATVYMQDLADFANMNVIYTEYLPENPPARSTFQVAKLPLGALVEIEMIAVLPD